MPSQTHSRFGQSELVVVTFGASVRMISVAATAAKEAIAVVERILQR